jgi:hypothetical protein
LEPPHNLQREPSVLSVYFNTQSIWFLCQDGNGDDSIVEISYATGISGWRLLKKDDAKNGSFFLKKYSY